MVGIIFLLLYTYIRYLYIESNLSLTNCNCFDIQCDLLVPVDMCDVEDGIWDKAGSQMLPVNDCLSILPAPRNHLD